jgi:hypothetical protein
MIVLPVGWEERNLVILDDVVLRMRRRGAVV